VNPFTRWWEVTRREFLAGLRRPSNWVLLVILGFMALGLSDGSVTVSSGESGVGGERPHLTSVYNQSMIQTIVMLVLAAWFLAISCGMVVIRDLELQVVEVFHSTRLTPREYVWGKFAGAVALFMVIWLLFPGLSMFLIHVVEGSGSSEVIGDFALGNYMFPTLLFGLPQTLFLAGVPFLLGTWTRRPIRAPNSGSCGMPGMSPEVAEGSRARNASPIPLRWGCPTEGRMPRATLVVASHPTRTRFRTPL